MVVVAPVPVVMTPPGERVSVQLPVAGKLLNATLPVGTEHVGCIGAPATGAPGITYTDANIAVLIPVVHPPDVAST